MSKITKEKYGALIMDIASTKPFRIDEMRMKHKVSTRVFTIMRDLGYIKSVPYSMHVWHADAPTQITINRIIKECRASSRIEKALANKTTSKQLTIKPLKRVASLVEPPVQSIDLHEESQLTWMHLLVIFAAGLIAGGLIATIWK